VFDSWSQWTWVTIAWLQLVFAYGGYLAYLGWRRRQLLRDDRASRALDGAQRAPEGAQRGPEGAQRGPEGAQRGPDRTSAGGRP
jgi:hypothetical protein